MTTSEQFKDRIKNPINAATLNKMAADERWIQCLALGTNRHLFLDKCKALLHPSLHNVVNEQFKTYSPAFLSADDGTVYTNYQKVFNSREGIEYAPSFIEGTELADFLEYTQKCYLTSPNEFDKGINRNDFYENIVTKDVLYAPNTRYIIDFAVSGEVSLPTVVRVAVSDIHDITERNGKTEYIITKRCYGRAAKDSELELIKTASEKQAYKFDLQTWYYCYSNSLFCLFVEFENAKGKYRLLDEVQNELGYLPCFAASNYFLTANNSIERKSPITTALPQIEWFNIATNFYNYHFLQKQIPPSVSISNNACDFTDFEGNKCENGLIAVPAYNLHGERVDNQFRYYPCEQCAERKKSKFTFGKEVAVDYAHIFPQGVNSEPRPEVLQIIKDSLGSIPTSIEFAKIAKDILDKEQNAILDVIIGNSFNAINSKEAFNEKYVSASLDDRRNNLVNFATKIEHLWANIDSTIAKARYYSFISISVFLGREYFFKTLLEYQNELSLLLKSGDVYMIAKKQYEIAQSEYGQHDPLQLAFYKALSNFMPFADLSIEQVLANKDSLISMGLEFKRRVYLRINAIEYVNEFINTLLPKYYMSVISPEVFYKKVKRWFYAQADKSIGIEINQNVSRETLPKIINHFSPKN